MSLTFVHIFHLESDFIFCSNILDIYFRSLVIPLSLDKDINGQTSLKTHVKIPINYPTWSKFSAWCDFFYRIDMGDYEANP